MPRGTNRPRLSASTMSLDFRTPVGSSRGTMYYVCVHMYLCIVCVHMDVCTCTCLHVRVYMDVFFTWTCLHVPMYVFTCTCLHVRMYVFTCVHMYACVCV